MRHLIYLISTTTLAALVWLIGCVGADAARPESGGQKPAAAQLKVFLDCEACYADYLQTSVTFVGLRSRSNRGGSPRADYSRRHGRRRVRVHLRVHRPQPIRRPQRHAQNRNRDCRHRRHHPASARDVAARRARAVPDARRRAARAQTRSDARVRGRAAGGCGRSLEELGVQFAGLGLGPRRGVESLAGARRERQRRSHHAGLEDHARF